jgi:uncharacterized damage-inducible protein DinB
MDLLERLLGHDSWTTRQLLNKAELLTDSQLDHEFDMGHLTVRRTFEHVIRNVECWTDLMQGNKPRHRPDSAQSVDDLTARFEAAAAELLEFAREIVAQDRLDDTFVDTLDTPPQEKSFGGTILHVATHGMHHRAQLLFMLRRLGVAELPEGDVLSWELAVRE